MHVEVAEEDLLLGLAEGGRGRLSFCRTLREGARGERDGCHLSRRLVIAEGTSAECVEPAGGENHEDDQGIDKASQHGPLK